MRRPFLAAALLLVLPATLAACLWDRDTPAAEAVGRRRVVDAITGRFERYPPLYYEMRFARVSAHLRDHPDDLAALDDAAVACDRLGRGDEAIAWMRRKGEQLDRLGSSAAADHRYRYHANLGTFLAHRWIRAGADRSDLSDLQGGRDEIAAALAINPDAHFGRERYQLMALDWLLHPPEVGSSQYLPTIFGWDREDLSGEETEPADAARAAEGLAGLVVLGNAWESVDIFNALMAALQRDSTGYERGRNGGRNYLSYFAWLRAVELVDAGKGSLLPGAPTGPALRHLLRRPDFSDPGKFLDRSFRSLRDEADALHASRTAFMLPRLHSGRHPDTDPTFWHGYHEPPPPPLPETSVPEVFLARENRIRAIVFGVALGTPILLILVLAGFKRYSRRQKTTIAL